MTRPIEVFTANTPNGLKIPLALEELGADYGLRLMQPGSPSLRSADFLAINPNAKIPAIRHRLPSGETVTLFESGAILLHLAEHFGGLIGVTPQGRANTLAWLFLQTSGSGPMMGQAGHFLSMKSPDPYALGRFEAEARRYFVLLEERLSGGAWIDREAYSVADIAHFAWARHASYAGTDIADFPAIAEWVARIEERPATQRALTMLSREKLQKAEGCESATLPTSSAQGGSR